MRDDLPANAEQTEEIKHRYMNLHYRSSIGAILQIPCCTRPYICYVMDKQSRYGNKPRFTKINNSMDKTVTKEKKKAK